MPTLLHPSRNPPYRYIWISLEICWIKPPRSRALQRYNRSNCPYVTRRRDIIELMWSIEFQRKPWSLSVCCFWLSESNIESGLKENAYVESRGMQEWVDQQIVTYSTIVFFVPNATLENMLPVIRCVRSFCAKLKKKKNVPKFIIYGDPNKDNWF